ncbi:hypothetical protein BSZ35_17985 [Salinibacter sp. 10B]|uniref:hypothetical protein n=1 Tax=Salinibacter sp. 10B TaxID=1923971 RepID=UPI000CF5299E|nr:hypothetical protein [Salinibacter sp. 10B]PQJ26823.1 hypothetical protein BSZ35_17985 [Salinibacter sp. 10B]
MRSVASILTIAALLVFVGPAQAQTDARHVDLEVEPLAYAFGGAGWHVYHAGRWKYEIEVFGLEIPESLPENDSFTASPLGAELHFERFSGEASGGFYIGPRRGSFASTSPTRAAGRASSVFGTRSGCGAGISSIRVLATTT